MLQIDTGIRYFSKIENDLLSDLIYECIFFTAKVAIIIFKISDTFYNITSGLEVKPASKPNEK